MANRINRLSPELSRFKPKLFYYIFIPCDLFSLVVQAAGGGLSTSTAGKSHTGVNLALVGLSFQVFTIVLFCAFFGDYLFRYFRSGIWRDAGTTSGIKDAYGTRLSQATRLKLFFGFTALAILLTLARCAYRLAELHEGYGGSLARDEPLFIGMEGV